MSNFKTCHYLNLLNDTVVSIGEISDEAEQTFLIDGVLALPHMLSSDPIGQAAESFAHLGIKPQHKTFELMMTLKKIHPAFNPSQF